MNRHWLKSACLLTAGFGVGILAAHFPDAAASNTPGMAPMAQREFLVSINEIRQTFVRDDRFSGRYSRTVILSDGTRRHIELVPMIHDGMQVVEFRDNDGRTYMGVDGTATNGKLMVQLREVQTMNRRLKAHGWPVPVR